MSPEDTATESFKCNGVCSRKDGSKTRGGFCTERCKCLATGKNCQNQVGFLLSFSLTSYFSCFRCIPNNSTQMNDHSNVFYAISLNRTEKPKRKFVTRLSSLAISSDSKCAANSESLLKQLLPFKNFHILWIRLRSQTRHQLPRSR